MQIEKIDVSNSKYKNKDTFYELYMTAFNPGTDSGLVKLVVMTNIFFNNQQHKIKTRQFISLKQIKSSFFSNNGNQLFYS